MRRSLALLVIWMFLSVSSPLAATRPNKAYEELQHKYEAALQEIERLRSELARLKGEPTAGPAPAAPPAASAPSGDFLQTGNAHFLAQRYTEAIAAYTRAIEAAPRDARVYKHRGLAHAKLGHVQQAYEDLSQAIVLDPQDAVAYNQRGIASFAAGNVQAALKDFSKTIELQPQLAEAYNNRGIMARTLGDYRQAGKDFERAAQLGMELMHASSVLVFVASAGAIVPLAGHIGKATEHLAEHTGPGIGGLLNATFGNAAELIIALMALQRGLHDVVKASITGSIVGNVLLVLGLSVLCGGLRYERQTFNRTAAGVGSTLLALSAIGLLVPALFHQIVVRQRVTHERELSLDISIVLFITYLLSLVFSLRTHKHLYRPDAPSPTQEAAHDIVAWS